MTGPSDDDLEQIRERKRQELLDRASGLNESDSAAPSSQAGTSSTDRTGVTSATEPIEVRDASHFDSLLAEHPLVLVDCYADWCGPCQMMKPVLETIAADTAATVATVDVDSQPQLARRLGVRSIPTLVLFKNGDPVEQLVGAQDRHRLQAIIDRHRD